MRRVMTRIRYAAAACAAIVALVVAGPAAAATKLVATVGPGFTITLTKGGKKVTRLAPGAYTITVRDRAAVHNFFLRGPGRLSRNSGIGFVGTRTWNVTLRRGTYTYVCTPHATMMKGSFRVG
jgi:plastocyanin